MKTKRDEWQAFADRAVVGTYENERWPFLKMVSAANEIIAALEGKEG